MFEKILNWIKEMFAKMIGQSTVKQALKVDIAISEPMAEALALWARMYENKADWLNKDVKSLNLAASIAGEITRAVTVEMEVEFTGSPRAAFLQAQFDRILPHLRGKLEYGCAKGGLVMKPYVSGKEIAIDFVQADQFYPVSFDANGNITTIVFADQRRIGDKYYTRLELHQMVEGGCQVVNRAFVSDNSEVLGREIPLASVDAWAELVPDALIKDIDKPLFAYFRYPLANNIDPTSPLGVSCYSRAIDLIHDADVQWSNLLWEFESGQRALYADVLAYGRDADGNPILPQKRLYRALNGGSNIGEEELFKEWTPTLREENILRGLDAILKRIEYTCGLAYGTLSDPQTVDKTATEIKSSKQRTYATVTDAQKALQMALEQLAYAMDVWATLGKLAPIGAYEASFDFDDSVVVDTDARFKQDAQAVGMGVMPKWEFRMRNYGETEAVAKARVKEVMAEQPTDLFGTGVQ